MERPNSQRGTEVITRLLETERNPLTLGLEPGTYDDVGIAKVLGFRLQEAYATGSLADILKLLDFEREVYLALSVGTVNTNEEMEALVAGEMAKLDPGNHFDGTQGAVELARVLDERRVITPTVHLCELTYGTSGWCLTSYIDGGKPSETYSHMNLDELLRARLYIFRTQAELNPSLAGIYVTIIAMRLERLDVSDELAELDLGDLGSLSLE